MPAISREHRIYLALWRKAYREDKAIEIKLSTFSEALTLRSAMYRAIKPFIEGMNPDEELVAVREKFAISVLPQSNILTIRPKILLGKLEGMLEGLGVDERDLMTPEEIRALDALEEFITPADAAKLGPNDLPPTKLPLAAPNPFFKRED